MGSMLALIYLRDAGRRKPRSGIVHGLMGATGLGLLIIAIQGPRRGDEMGVGSFGFTAAVLFGLALAFGPLIPVSHRRLPQIASLILVTHAILAITGFVLFLAWISLR
jgi:hypothetical protein